MRQFVETWYNFAQLVHHGFRLAPLSHWALTNNEAFIIIIIIIIVVVVSGFN